MRVLHLTTYPVEVPRHGGQARVANMMATYRAAGLESYSVAIYEPEIYGPGSLGPFDVVFPVRSSHRRSDLPLCTDLASGLFAAHDEEAWPALRARFQELKPDVVQLEQPWMWPLAARWRREGLGSFRLVYSSQNVEAPLKQNVLDGYASGLVERVMGEIEALERAVVRDADLVIAVTQADAETYRRWGARRVTLAPNGIAERAVPEDVLTAWRNKLDGLRFALFVASAYPPNLFGFWQMFAPSLAFLAPHHRIVVVGGICGILTDHPQFARWRDVNANRLVLLDMQDEATLGALLDLASCIVLPITSGGGSNIKTAEAIFARRPVIGTTTSFRGYEELVGALPGLHRTDDAADFRRLVKRALDDELPLPSHERPGLRRRVLWSETLARLPEELRALAHGGAADGDGAR